MLLTRSPRSLAVDLAGLMAGLASILLINIQCYTNLYAILFENVAGILAILQRRACKAQAGPRLSVELRKDDVLLRQSRRDSYVSAPIAMGWVLTVWA